MPKGMTKSIEDLGKQAGLLTVKVKKTHPDAVIPKYAKFGDAGLDLTAVYVEETAYHMIYDTGLAFEIPPGHVGLVFPRSSVSKTDLDLANAVGVIDSSYRGPIILKFNKIIRSSPGDGVMFEGSTRYKKGDRVGQILIIPYPSIELEEVHELSDTERGSGGFGSTGK